jgi:cell division transport system ATP-binding protein
LIRLEDVSKRYPNGTAALQDVDLSIDQGDFAFLVGSSGAGKSTLIRLLIRDELPTTGKVTVDGNDVGKLRRSQIPHLRRLVGVVFQDFKLLPTRTVAENIAFALLVTGHEGRVVREETDRALALVGLTQRRGHFPRELSGGEQQRVAIVRALANDPKLLLADEPTGNLDHATGDSVMNTLLDLVRHTGLTALIATHNPDLARRLDRIIALEDGRLKPLD